MVLLRGPAFFKIQARVDLEGCKHYHFYLHAAPERVRHVTLASPTPTPDNDPNTRCLRFDMMQPAILVAPCWPCRAKNPQSEKTLQLLQLLGQAAFFNLVVNIPHRTIPDASFRALSNALASQSITSDPDQSNIRRYYRGQGGTAVDLTCPPITDVLKGKQPQSCTGGSSDLTTGLADVPPSYNQAVTDASSPDPLSCSPPNKKRRRDSPNTEPDNLFPPTKSFGEDIKQLVPESSQLSLFRSMFEHFDKAVTELKEENRQLRQAVSEVADMRASIAALNSKVESLESRLNTEGEELERRIDGLEDGLTSLDAWTEDHHEYDADQVKDVVREVFEEDFDDVLGHVRTRTSAFYRRSSPAVPFDTSFYAAAYSAQSANSICNAPAGGSKPKTCQFLNPYMQLLKDGVSEGQYRSLVSGEQLC
ncbi:hypothetical protein PG990_003084 [Apiospora arundinis]